MISPIAAIQLKTEWKIKDIIEIVELMESEIFSQHVETDDGDKADTLAGVSKLLSTAIYRLQEIENE